MTLEKFHSFIKLVRMMHNIQQESYAAHSRDYNLSQQAKALEMRVAKELPELVYHPEHYTWQQRFIEVVKQVRAQQALYESTGYESQLLKCREREKELEKAIIYIEVTHPEVFNSSTKQSKLSF